MTFRTARLVLDQPTSSDVDAITEYCQDPLFEQYLTTPWPYRREDAVSFVREHVPSGWAEDREYTWALRLDDGAPLLGVLGVRRERDDMGFWLGTPHRGHGYLPEAARAVIDWMFADLDAGRVRWEAVVGNTSSAAVARKLGFTFTGIAPAEVPSRDGTRPDSWHGILVASDTRGQKAGWPT